MKIGILTTTGDKEENHRLIAAAHERGYKAQLLHHLKCSLSVCEDAPEVTYEGKPISKEFDIIIPRIDAPHAEYGLTVLRQFEAIHTFTSETTQSIQIARDKLRCSQHLLKHHVPFPSTGFAYSKADFDNIIDTVGGAPLIIKLIEGTEGVGVFLAEDTKHAINLLKTFKQLSTPLIVQKFIKESGGKDIRVFVCGGRVVTAIQRQSQDGDFRANLAQGGASKVIKLTKQEEEVAINATRAIGINVAGVDLIRSNTGPLIIEINSALDFCGKWNLEDVAGIDVAGEIIDRAVMEKKNITDTFLTEKQAA